MQLKVILKSAWSPVCLGILCTVFCIIMGLGFDELHVLRIAPTGERGHFELPGQEVAAYESGWVALAGQERLEFSWIPLRAEDLDLKPSGRRKEFYDLTVRASDENGSYQTTTYHAWYRGFPWLCVEMRSNLFTQHGLNKGVSSESLDVYPETVFGGILWMRTLGNILVWAILAGLIQLGVPWLRGKHRVMRGLCRLCGYDLRGTPGSQCPECGASTDPSGGCVDERSGKTVTDQDSCE